jgi:hypothetical protein
MDGEWISFEEASVDDLLIPLMFCISDRRRR